MIADQWYIVDRDTDIPLFGPCATAKEASDERDRWEARGTNRNLWVTKWGLLPPEKDVYDLVEGEHFEGSAKVAPAEEWYASTNGEHYTTGPFVCRQDAIQEMLAGWGETNFWTGRAEPLTLDEIITVDLSSLEVRAAEAGGEIVGEYIEDWKFGMTKENLAAAEAEINAAVVAILKKYDCESPGCYKIMHAEEYTGVKE